MGDMICTIPILRALRTHLPKAHLAVLCDPRGVLIAHASGAVDTVKVVKKGLNRWHSRIRNRSAVAGFDLVIGVKGRFDRLLADVVRSSGAPYRIGFASSTEKGDFYTHPITLRDATGREHQIETGLRLLQPLGFTADPLNFRFDPSTEAKRFARAVAEKHHFASHPWACLINLSCHRGLCWPLPEYAELIRLLTTRLNAKVGLSFLPADAAAQRKLVAAVGSDKLFSLSCPTPLHLAAVLQRVRFLLTPDGGAAHLAAAMGTPALVLWPSVAIQKKRQSRSSHHHHLALGNLPMLRAVNLFDIVREKFGA